MVLATICKYKMYLNLALKTREGPNPKHKHLFMNTQNLDIKRKKSLAIRSPKLQKMTQEKPLPKGYWDTVLKK